MDYGLFLYKNWGSDLRLEIWRKGWAGRAVEIEAMDETALELVGLDNAGEDVLTPIIKSTVNINIKNLGEIKYKELFTSDATKFKVVIKEKGAQVWGGYITPDSYSQPYEYRNSVNLIARDNLGMLDQLDYDWFDSDFVTPAQLVVEAQKRISWVMLPIEWQLQTLISADSTQIRDAYINTVLFNEKTWWEVLEMVLSSLGQQMRYAGNNRVFICSVSELHGLKEFGLPQQLDYSVGSSATMEIVPSWKQLDVKQDYGKLKNAMKGFPQATTDFIADKTLSIAGFCPEIKSDYFDWSENYVDIPMFTLNKWVNNKPDSASKLLMANPYKFPLQKEDKGIYITNKNALRENDTQDYISTFIKTPKIDGSGIQFQFEVANRFYTPYFQYDWNTDINWIDPIFKTLIPDVGNRYLYKLRWRFQLIFRYTNDEGVKKELILKEKWENYAGNENFIISFEVDAPRVEKIGSSKVSIIAESIPYDGELELRIFRWEYVPQESGVELKYPYNQFGRIVDIVLEPYQNENGSQTLKGSVNPTGNVKESIDIEIGEVPASSGDYLAYAGGLFDGTPYHKALTGWHRSDNKGGVRTLSELIGRGYAHHFTAFRSDTGEKTGGELITASIPFGDTLCFSHLFQLDERDYLVNAGTYDMVRRRANVTLRQVLPYEHQDSTYEINAVSGGGKSVVGGGDNTVVTWGGGVGAYEIKRTYELKTQNNVAGAYVLIDTPGDETASKVPIEEIGGMSVEALKKIFHPLFGDKTMDFIAKLLEAEAIKAKTVDAAETITANKAIANDFTTPELHSAMLGGYGGGLLTNPETGETDLWVDHVHARQSFETLELRYRKMLVSGEELVINNGGVVEKVQANSSFLTANDGRLIVTQDERYIFWPSAGKVSFEIKGTPGVDLQQFEENDIVRYTWRDSKTGTQGASGYLLVSSVIDDFAYTADIISGSPENLMPGMTLALFGNLTNPDRQGFIVLSARERTIAIYDGVKSQFISPENLKVLIGNLNGVVDPRVPEIKGYGLYSQNCYLVGEFVLRNTGESLGESIPSIKAQAALTEKRLSDWASDKIISPLEKTGLELFFQKAISDYSKIMSEASRWGLTNHQNYKDIQSAWTKANTAYIKYTRNTPENIPIEDDYSNISNFNNHVTAMWAIIEQARKSYSDNNFTTKTTFETEVKRTNEALSQRATSTEFNALSGRVTNSESTITQHSKEIESKVSTNGVVSAINQTAETIKIDAKRISLTGYTSINGGFAVDAAGNTWVRSGTIGGFSISNGVLTGTASTNAVIRFQDGTQYAGIGANILPVESGMAGNARFESHSNGGNNNTAIYASAKRGITNDALYMASGTIGGYAIRTRQINSSQTLTHADCYVTCYNTSEININLPLPDLAQVGKVYYIRQMYDAGVKIRGKIHNGGEQHEGWFWCGKGRGDVVMLVNDGQYWCYNMIARY